MNRTASGERGQLFYPTATIYLRVLYQHLHEGFRIIRINLFQENQSQFPEHEAKALFDAAFIHI
jgi:hypothetical protein